MDNRMDHTPIAYAHTNHGIVGGVRCRSVPIGC
jgi:hypothetical protein